MLGYFVSIAFVYSLAEKTLKNRADTFVRVIPVVFYLILSSYLLIKLTGTNIVNGAIIFTSVIYLLYLIGLTTIYKRIRPENYAKLVEKNSVY